MTPGPPGRNILSDRATEASMRKGIDLRRRHILAGLAVAVGTPLPSFAGTSGLHVWVHERKPGPVGSLVLGGLFIREPGVLAATLTAARRSTQFFAPLRYADSNRFKRDYAHAALDVFLTDASSYYSVLVAQWPSDPLRRRAVYYDAYVRLLQGQTGVGLALHKPPNRTVGPEAALDRHLMVQLPMLRPARRLGGDIAELAGFITGNVAASAHRPDNPVKTELIRHVMARLAESPKFSVTVI